VHQANLNFEYTVTRNGNLKFPLYNLNTLPPVVILGSGGLGLIRSLGEKGVRSIVIDDDDKQLYRNSSRYCRHIIRVPPMDKCPNRTIDAIFSIWHLNCKASIPKLVVFPTSDHALVFLLTHWKKVSEFAEIACGPPEVVDITVDKYKFYLWLEGNGFPSPKTWFGDAEDEGVGKIGRGIASFPCIVKPAFTHLLERVDGKKLHIAKDVDHLKRVCERLSKRKMKYIIQEIVPGPVENQFALAGYSLPGGRIGCCIITNKLRQSDFGAGTCVSGAFVPGLFELGKRLISELKYKGIFEIEFKRDARDERLKIIELNARSWSQVILATRMRVNVPYMAYCDLAGLCSCERPIYSKGGRKRYWISLERDLAVVKEKIGNGGLPVSRLFRQVLTMPTVEPFDLRDPRPGLLYLKDKLTRFFHKIMRGEK